MYSYSILDLPDDIIYLISAHLSHLKDFLNFKNINRKNRKAMGRYMDYLLSQFFSRDVKFLAKYIVYNNIQSDQFLFLSQNSSRFISLVKHFAKLNNYDLFVKCWPYSMTYPKSSLSAFVKFDNSDIKHLIQNLNSNDQYSLYLVNNKFDLLKSLHLKNDAFDPKYGLPSSEGLQYLYNSSNLDFNKLHEAIAYSSTERIIDLKNFLITNHMSCHWFNNQCLIKCKTYTEYLEKSKILKMMNINMKIDFTTASTIKMICRDKNNDMDILSDYILNRWRLFGFSWDYIDQIYIYYKRNYKKWFFSFSSIRLQ